MPTFLKIVRWLIAILLILILLVTLVVGIISSAVATTVTNPDNIKTYLKQSGIYENAVDIALDYMSAQYDEESDMSELKNTAQKILTPKILETNVNAAIDGTYAWLEGKTTKPEFEIQLIQDQKTIEQILLENAPPEAEQMIQEMSDSGEFDELMNSAKYSSDQFNMDPAVSRDTQLTFYILKLSPWISVSIVFILLLLLILIIPGWKASFLTTGIITLIESVFILLMSLLARGSYDIAVNLILAQIPSQELASSQSLIDQLTVIIKLIFTDVMTKIGWYSLAVIVVSIILIVIGIVVKSKSTSNAPAQPLK